MIKCEQQHRDPKQTRTKLSSFAEMLEELERKHGYQRNDVQLIKRERRNAANK
jgi:hypothetical protein